MGGLESAINRPFATFGGEDLYKDIFEKAGAMIQSIVKNHPFLDANKRTAWVSSYTFLRANKLEIKTSREKVVSFMLSVANQNLSVDEIATWLKKHSKKV